MKESRQSASLKAGGALDVPPLDTPSASDGVARVIRGLIFSGELSPGDWLPPSRDLAERLGISQLTLRVGLRSLETSGYLVTSRGAHGGTRVGDIETLSRIWVAWMEAKGDEVRDMWEFREIVESHVAMFAAERRTRQELAAIEAALASAAADSHTAVLRWNVVVPRCPGRRRAQQPSRAGRRLRTPGALPARGPAAAGASGRRAARRARGGLRRRARP